MWNFIVWIALGLVAGALAKWIKPGDQGGGCLMTTVLGVIGAFVGGWLGSFLGIGTTGGFSFSSIITAVVGALVVLWIYDKVSKK